MLVAVAGSVGVGCSVLLGIDGIEYGSSGDAADGQQDVRGLDSTTDAGADGDGDGDGDASEAEASCDGCGPKLLRVAAGPYHACVLRSDGYVYCWGYNGYYGLGSSQIVAGTCPGTDYCVPTPSLVL